MERRNTTFMEKLASVIVDRRSIIFFVVIALAIFSAFSRNWVRVCDDITAYLPSDTETREGLSIMEENFTTFATARIMLENITLENAENIASMMENVEGVKSIEFDGDENFKNASAYYSVTFDGEDNDQISIDGLKEVKTIISGYDSYVSTEIGNPLKQIINGEMLVVDAIAVFIVVSVLLLTSSTYAEIPVLLITFGAAAILNMGTNFLFGEISFVTDSIAIVLQLALAIDYAIILLHHYQEEHVKLAPREATIAALSKSIPEIAGSSLTTIAGLASMCLMEFKLGPDMGIILIKAIALSLLSVFFLMPGLLVLFADWMDRSKHSNFIPPISGIGKFDYATRFIMPVVFVGVLVCGFVLQNKAHYVYSQDSIRSFKRNEQQLAEEKINGLFGKDNQFAVIVPSGNYATEKMVIDEIESLEHTVEVTGLANVEAKDGIFITDSLNPRQFSELAGLDNEVAEGLYLAYSVQTEEYGRALTNIESYTVPLLDMFDYLIKEKKEVYLDLGEETENRLDELEDQLGDARLQLLNNGWSRIVVKSDLPVEGEESFRYLNILHGVIEKHYPECYVVGDTTSCSDLKSSFEKDNTLINILNIVFVIFVLIITFNSVGLPVLLIMIIQGSIWANFSTPYLEGNNLFFLTNLIVSSIMMGANIDYAIVISSRYLEMKQKLPLKQAMIETLNFAFPTIITSGTMLVSAGFIIYFLTSNETICTIGLFLGQGTLISIFLVMFVLPQILLLGDIIIRNTSFSIKRRNQLVKRAGLVRIDGRVRGTMNGFVDAEVHGVFRGEISAMIDMNNIKQLEDENEKIPGKIPEEHAHE